MLFKLACAFGDNRPALRGCSAGKRCACTLHWQGAQGARHTADQSKQ